MNKFCEERFAATRQQLKNLNKIRLLSWIYLQWCTLVKLKPLEQGKWNPWLKARISEWFGGSGPTTALNSIWTAIALCMCWLCSQSLLTCGAWLCVSCKEKMDKIAKSTPQNLLDGSSWLSFSSNLQELSLVIQINSLNSWHYLGRSTTKLMGDIWT